MRLATSRIAYLIYAAIAVGAIPVASSFYARPRAWTVAEVPIAFWSWRKQAPPQADVFHAIEKTKATSIFLRAGQIDQHEGKLRRIRPLTGSYPHGIELHLVYNATRALLGEFETVDHQSLSNTILNSYREDLERANNDGANVRGLQLDIDVPTRLLSGYEKTLVTLRRDLPSGTQLSITGLPTWMESADLDQLLKQVDFWVPQFYGAQIPQRSDQIIPISSPETVAHFVRRARELNRPFYAGLSAYSVAILYGRSGELVNLRGDMNPSAIASDANLELIDKRNFADEWRYVFRARNAGVTDDLAMNAGDVLVVQLPTVESLRTAASIVREQAGEKLLGVCVFRLPTRDDPAALTAEQVYSALTDQDSSAKIDIRITPDYTLEFRNTGTASALVDSVQVDLTLPPGSFEGIRSNISFETLCADKQPCSQRRANLIRLKPKALAAGQTFTATLVLNRTAPTTIPVSLTMATDAGNTYSIHRDVSIERGVSQ